MVTLETGSFSPVVGRALMLHASLRPYGRRCGGLSALQLQRLQAASADEEARSENS